MDEGNLMTTRYLKVLGDDYVQEVVKFTFHSAIFFMCQKFN
jgi:hypothetical protein